MVVGFIIAVFELVLMLASPVIGYHVSPFTLISLTYVHIRTQRNRSSGKMYHLILLDCNSYCCVSISPLNKVYSNYPKRVYKREDPLFPVMRYYLYNNSNNNYTVADIFENQVQRNIKTKVWSKSELISNMPRSYGNKQMYQAKL